MKQRIADLIRQRNEGRSLKQPPAPKHPEPKAAELEQQLLVQRVSAGIERSEIEHCLADIREGRLYTFANISSMLRCSKETARILFRKEPGILKFRHVYRIPETVLQRVLSRLVQRKLS